MIASIAFMLRTPASCDLNTLVVDTTILSCPYKSDNGGSNSSNLSNAASYSEGM